jgi:hypothetical protein
MAKKRTGLQSEIAGIFSGVPVPKKGGGKSKSDSPEQKPDSPASKIGDPVMPKPPATQPKVPPVAPIPKEIEKPAPAAPKPKVIEIKAPEQVVKKIPKKISKRRKNKTFATKAGVSASRQKAAITLLLLFSTALVIVLARQYKIPPRKPNPPETPGDTIKESSTMAEIEIDWPIPPVYSADLHDPMILGEPPPPPPPPPPPGEVVVRGIVVSEDRKYAVIERIDLQRGSIVNYLQEGGIVPGTNKKVKKINPNNVEFEEDGKTWTQEVEGEKR